MHYDSFIRNFYKGFEKRFASLFQNPYKEVNVNWLRLKYYKHLPSGKLRTHYLFGKPFLFYSPEELLHAFDEIFIEQVYKMDLINKPYIIDCGANIGLSVIYMKQLYPDAEIVAFEPDKKNFALLEKNINAFGYQNVTLRNEAVWNENSIISFWNEGSMSSKISDNNDLNTIKVKAIKLRDLINREIDFLKIDIEGAEFIVLSDISDQLHFVKNMFIEYHGIFRQNDELVKLLSLVNKSGFNFYIKEATDLYKTPFCRIENNKLSYDVQLNIFCFRLKKNIN